MPEKNGAKGAIDGVPCIRNWSLNDLAETKEFACSATQGRRGRRAGIEDFNGSFEQYGGTPTLMPGECFTFEGFTGPDAVDCGPSSGDGNIYTGEAIIDQVAITWNWEASEEIMIASSFSGNGPLTIENGEILDEETPIILPTTGSKGFFISSDGSVGNEAELCGIKSATLTFTADNTTYANSCTDGQRERNPGIGDWSLALNVDGDDRSNLQNIQKNSSYIFHLYIDSTQYFQLKWGIVNDFSNLVVDVETRAIIGHTVNILENSISLAGVVGTILLPDGTTYFPEGGSSSGS